MTDSVQSLDSVIGRSHGKLWNVHTCNIRFKASKSSFGSYAVCILVDGKLSLPIPVKKSPMLKAWAWNDMVHTRSIISYMGIIAPANKIKRLEFLLHIMPWYHKYMYSVDCGLMIWRKGRGYWSLHFSQGNMIRSLNGSRSPASVFHGHIILNLTDIKMCADLENSKLKNL